jgi:hypothetical protein
MACRLQKYLETSINRNINILCIEIHFSEKDSQVLTRLSKGSMIQVEPAICNLKGIKEQLGMQTTEWLTDEEIREKVREETHIRVLETCKVSSLINP